MSVRDAVIVSTARTAIGRAYKRRVQRHALADARAPTRSAPRSSAPASIPPRSTTCIMGAALQQGVQATIGRTAALRAGLPGDRRRNVDRPPMRVGPDGHRHRRQAGHRRPHGRVRRRRRRNRSRWSRPPEMRLGPDMELLAMHPHVYMPMIDTAEVVAKRYGISRERCDEYALESQRRTAAAQASRPVRRRDRPGHRQDGRQGQGDRRRSRCTT